jgi:hypothetical protein
MKIGEYGRTSEPKLAWKSESANPALRLNASKCKQTQANEIKRKQTQANASTDLCGPMLVSSNLRGKREKIFAFEFDRCTLHRIQFTGPPRM